MALADEVPRLRVAAIQWTALANYVCTCGRGSTVLAPNHDHRCLVFIAWSHRNDYRRLTTTTLPPGWHWPALSDSQLESEQDGGPPLCACGRAHYDPFCEPVRD